MLLYNGTNNHVGGNGSEIQRIFHSGAHLDPLRCSCLCEERKQGLRERPEPAASGQLCRCGLISVLTVVMSTQRLKKMANNTKHLLNQALNLYKPTSSTPKSFNTPLGISMFLNNTNVNMYDNLVLEFGISKVNDMFKLKELVPPNIAFITDIGYMHMETFKDINILIKEKL